MDYNQGMKNKTFTILLMGMVLLSSLGAARAQQTQPSGYDLEAAVNAYRASNGYYQLNHHDLVMAAAQTHAEWIVATGQGGHIGASGSDETVRVSWTGYGGGSDIQCDENWAGGRSIEDAVYGSWSDWVHQEVMLNAWGNRYTDIGGGVAARGDGSYVFVLNVCKVVGQEASGKMPEPNTNPNPLATPDRSNIIFGVTRATPGADGSIIHKVLYGQSLASIAQAYGITIETLRTLNGMDAGETMIWVDEELVIQPATSAAAGQRNMAADTSTAPSPTATPATPTQQPTRIPTGTPFPTPTQPPQTDAEDGKPAPVLGMLVLGLSTAGLVAFLLLSRGRG